MSSDEGLDGCSRDSLFRGRLVLWQPGRGNGYRFNLDPVLLAGFVGPAGHVLDLGAGCGIIGLCLLSMGKAERVTAVEVQPQLARLAQKNGQENGFERQFDVVCGDLRTTDLPSADAVVFNPPFFPRGRGRLPPENGRGIARHECFGGLDSFVGRAREQMQPGGWLAGVVRVQRRDELRSLCEAQGLFVSRLREVRPRAHGETQAVLLEARKGVGSGQRPGPMVREGPLIVHEEAGREFSPEVKGLLFED